LKKKLFSVLLALVLALSLCLVTATPVAAIAPAVPDRTTAITATADRLVALQGTDGGWDWVVTDLTAHSGTYPSPANLFGVTALGLIDAYEVTGDEAYKTAAQVTADHLLTLDRAVDPNVRIQSFDYRFLVEFSALSGDPSYEAHAIEQWSVAKAASDFHYGDGNQENIYDFWFTHTDPDSHGFAAWSASDMGLAALAMGDTSWASNMAAVLVLHLAGIDQGDIYRVIGLGHALEFLNAVDPETYSTQITNLIAGLTGTQNADGSWPGTADQGTVQNTAYAVMGLVAVGEAGAARKGANWLVANQISIGDSIGGWIENDGKEYSENDSEALQALASVSAPVTIDTKGYYSIQAAIDSASPNDTISVTAGTYAGANVDRAVTIPGAADGPSISTSWSH